MCKAVLILEEKKRFNHSKIGNVKNGYNESRVVFCRIISGISLSSEFSRFFLPKCRGKIHLFLSPLKLYEQWSVNLSKLIVPASWISITATSLFKTTDTECPGRREKNAFFSDWVSEWVGRAIFLLKVWQLDTNV